VPTFHISFVLLCRGALLYLTPVDERTLYSNGFAGIKFALICSRQFCLAYQRIRMCVCMHATVALFSVLANLVFYHSQSCLVHRVHCRKSFFKPTKADPLQFSSALRCLFHFFLSTRFSVQGCQIFLGTRYQKNVPKKRKMYQMVI
jgi:hypothetical protein